MSQDLFNYGEVIRREPRFVLSDAGPTPLAQALQRISDLVDEVARLRSEISRREEAAYEHGLADRAEVMRQNRILAATIAALTDRAHPLRLPEIR